MTAGQPVYRVGICGSYGGLNLGDEAILRAMICELRRALPVEITVFSRNAADTLARHAVERTVPVRELSRREVTPEIQRLDLLILGGGGILYDADASTYLREVQVANEVGVLAMVYAVGAGPLGDPAAQRLVQRCLERVAAVTVREREAQRVLEQAGVAREIVATADPAFLLEPEPFPEDAFERKRLGEMRRMVVVSVARLDALGPGHARTAPTRAVPTRARRPLPVAVAVPAPGVRRHICARRQTARSHAGELAPERLLRRQPHRPTT
jgi:polysaccharide pyruvyl transferase WcaK-like protein